MQTNTEKDYGDRNSVGSKTASLGSAGPAQAEPRERRKKRKKRKIKKVRFRSIKSFDDYRELLSLMPPLRYEPRNYESDVRDSDVCMFILLAMDLSPKYWKSWEYAQNAFFEAHTNQILIANDKLTVWCGRDYRASGEGKKQNWIRPIRQIMSQIGKAQHRRWRIQSESKFRSSGIIDSIQIPQTADTVSTHKA